MVDWIYSLDTLQGLVDMVTRTGKMAWFCLGAGSLDIW